MADVWREASGEEENAHLQMQPESHLQRHLRIRRPLGTDQRLRFGRPGHGL